MTTEFILTNTCQGLALISFTAGVESVRMACLLSWSNIDLDEYFREPLSHSTTQITM
jgi:hypothetical protein